MVAWLCPKVLSYFSNFIGLHTVFIVLCLRRSSSNIYQKNLLKVKFEQKKKQLTLQYEVYTIRYNSFPWTLKNGGLDWSGSNEFSYVKLPWLERFKIQRGGELRGEGRFNQFLSPAPKLSQYPGLLKQSHASFSSCRSVIGPKSTLTRLVFAPSAP